MKSRSRNHKQPAEHIAPPSNDDTLKKDPKDDEENTQSCTFISVILLVISVTCLATVSADFLRQIRDTSVNEPADLKARFSKLNLQDVSQTKLDFPSPFNHISTSYHGDDSILLEAQKPFTLHETQSPQQKFETRLSSMNLNFENFAKTELETAKTRKRQGETYEVDANIKDILHLKKQISTASERLQTLRKTQMDLYARMTQLNLGLNADDVMYQDNKQRVMIPNILIKNGIDVKNERFFEEQHYAVNLFNESALMTTYNQDCDLNSVSPAMFCTLTRVHEPKDWKAELNTFVQYSDTTSSGFHSKAAAFYNTIEAKIASNEFALRISDTSSTKYKIRAFCVISDFVDFAAHYAGSLFLENGKYTSLSSLPTDFKALEKKLVTYSSFILLQQVLKYGVDENSAQAGLIQRSMIYQHICLDFEYILEENKIHYSSLVSCALSDMSDQIRTRMIQGAQQLAASKLADRNANVKSLFKVFDVSKNQIL